MGSSFLRIFRWDTPSPRMCGNPQLKVGDIESSNMQIPPLLPFGMDGILSYRNPKRGDLFVLEVVRNLSPITESDVSINTELLVLRSERMADLQDGRPISNERSYRPLWKS